VIARTETCELFSSIFHFNCCFFHLSFSKLSQEQVEDFHYAFITHITKKNPIRDKFLEYLNLVESIPPLQSPIATKVIFSAFIAQDNVVP